MLAVACGNNNPGNVPQNPDSIKDSTKSDDDSKKGQLESDLHKKNDDLVKEPDNAITREKAKAYLKERRESQADTLTDEDKRMIKFLYKEKMDKFKADFLKKNINSLSEETFKKPGDFILLLDLSIEKHLPFTIKIINAHPVFYSSINKILGKEPSEDLPSGVILGLIQLRKNAILLKNAQKNMDMTKITNIRSQINNNYEEKVILNQLLRRANDTVVDLSSLERINSDENLAKLGSLEKIQLDIFSTFE